MPTLTLKNIPEPLYERLKQAASIHRRSLNSEILFQLEEALAPRRTDVSALIENARAIREKTAHYRLGQKELNRSKNDGRP
jgi:plasmid stability protein